MESGIKILVSGRVQGVFFRYYTEKKAKALGIRGKVKNCQDGRVEIIAFGNKDNLDAFQKWCYDGSPASSVEAVEVSIHETTKPYYDFVIDR